MKTGEIYRNQHSGKIFLITAVVKDRCQGIRPDGIVFWMYLFDFEKSGYILVETHESWYTALKKSKLFKEIRNV